MQSQIFEDIEQFSSGLLAVTIVTLIETGILSPDYP
jgi:hypothetical protein